MVWWSAVPSERRSLLISLTTCVDGVRGEPTTAPHRQPVFAHRDGCIRAIDNRRLARVAKLAGAPGSPEAGVDLHHRIGAPVRRGDTLFEIHARTAGELQYALDYALAHPAIIAVEEGA